MLIGSKMARISANFFRATATAPLFFTIAPLRRAPTFLVRASGAVALKVAQVPSTEIGIIRLFNAQDLLYLMLF